MSILNLNKISLIFWFITLSNSLLSVTIEFLGHHRFQAAGIANRIWILIVILLLFTFINKINVKQIYYFVGLLVLLFTGIANGNEAKNIIADSALIGLPLLYSFASIYALNKFSIESILKGYVTLNLVALIVVVPPLYLLLDRAIKVDYILLTSFVAISIAVTHCLRHQIIYIVTQFLLIFYYAETKTYLIQIITAYISVLGIMRKQTLIPLFFLTVTLYGLLTLSESVAISKVTVLFEDMDLVEIISYITHHEDFNLNDIFIMIDTSTAQRIFELALIIDHISKDNLTLIIGTGLGGAIDLSVTGDNSVVIAHGGINNLTNVRVVHTGVGFILLKAGVVGLVIYLVAFSKILLESILILKHEKYNYYIKILALTVILYLIGTLFTFSNYFKMPMLWFGVVYIFSLKEITLNISKSDVSIKNNKNRKNIFITK